MNMQAAAAVPPPKTMYQPYVPAANYDKPHFSPQQQLHKHPAQDERPNPPLVSATSMSMNKYANTASMSTNMNGNASGSTSPSKKVSPLDAAAQLIRHLDETFVSMSSAMQNSESDSNEARQRARNAMLMATRYQTRDHNNHKKAKNNSAPFSNKNSISSTNTTWRKRSSPPKNTNNTAGTARPPTTATQSNTTTTTDTNNNTSSTTSHKLIAQSHAEDVMALSLELEQTKQAYQSLQSSTNTNTQNYQSMVSELETKVEQAEEDANTALQLARDSADSREALESYLKRALSELECTRARIECLEEENQTLTVFNHNNNSSAIMTQSNNNHQLQTVVEEQTQLTPTAPKALIAMGRDMLHRRRNVLNKRFRQHKSQLENRKVNNNNDNNDNQSVNSNDSLKPPSSSNHRRVLQILRDSAKRLGFLSRLRGSSSENNNNGSSYGEEVTFEDDDLESLVEQYTRSAEVKMHMMSDEIKELKSLCEYLEKGMAFNNV